MQPFQVATYPKSDNDSDDNNTEAEKSSSKLPPPKKKKKLRKANQPLIIAICTQLMARANEMVQQSSEIVFCDSTSTLDRFGDSMFIISTTRACCSSPLGVMIVSDKKQETIKEGLEMLKRVCLPLHSMVGVYRWVLHYL